MRTFVFPSLLFVVVVFLSVFPSLLFVVVCSLCSLFLCRGLLRFALACGLLCSCSSLFVFVLFVVFCFCVVLVPVLPGQSSSLVASWLHRHAAGCSNTRRCRPVEVIGLAPRQCTSVGSLCASLRVDGNGPSYVRYGMAPVPLGQHAAEWLHSYP